MTYTRPLAITGLENPYPTGARHRTGRPSAGNGFRMPLSCQTPSRPLPRHCGQSSAREANARAKRITMIGLGMNSCCLKTGVSEARGASWNHHRSAAVSEGPAAASTDAKSRRMIPNRVASPCRCGWCSAHSRGPFPCAFGVGIKPGAGRIARHDWLSSRRVKQ